MPIPSSPPPAPAESPAAAGARGAWRAGVMFAGIAGLAVVLRLIYLYQSRGAALSGLLVVDARQYDAWSDAIAAGNWRGEGVFYQAPLYPYLLAVIKIVLSIGAEDSLWPVKVVQAVMGSLACGVLFLAGRRLISTRAGLIAGVMLAVYAPAVFFDSTIQKTSLATLLTCLLLWALAYGVRRAGALAFAAMGVALALLMLTREETIVLAPILGVWALGARAGRPRARLIRAAAFAGALALVLLPVAVRNYAVGGQFVLTTSQAGPNFYIGNNAAATGIYAPLRAGRSNTPLERRDAFELAEQARGRKLSAKEVDRYWRGKALEFIRSRPAAWARLMGRKVALLLNAYEVPDAEDQHYFERYSWLLRGLARMWHWGVLLPLAAAGATLAARWWRELLPLYTVVLATAGAVVLFFVFGRYRFPLAPMLMLLAGAGVSELVVMAVARRAAWGRVTIAGAAACAAAVASNWPMFERSREIAASHANAGAALAEAGQAERALAEYEQALRLNPAMPEVHANIALLQGRAGKTQEAIASLRAALAMRPEDARFHHMLGTLLAESGDLAGALTHLEMAAQGSPDIDTRVNLAQVAFALKQSRRGVAALREAARLAPEDLTVTLTLAWILATSSDDQLRDGGEALRLAEAAVRQTRGEDPEALQTLAAAQAEVGRFQDALAVIARAISVAQGQGRGELVKVLESNRIAYEQGRGWRE
jgi:tetratricopeptide (TPR) repeat protein